MEVGYKETNISNEIVDLSKRLFQQRGYKAFSYRDIAKEIGIKTSSIHYYFPTKDDLAFAIVKKYRNEFRIDRENIDKATSDPKSRIGLYLDLFVQSFRKNKNICFCSMLASDFVNLSDSVKEEVNNLFNDNLNWISNVLKDGLDKKIFSFEETPDDLAGVIFSSLEGATITSRTFDNDKTLLNTLDSIKKMYESKEKGFISKYLSRNR
jgi:TetR/AcrR family transcriptional repressor of nem operon